MHFQFEDGDASVAFSGELTFTDHGAFRDVANRLLTSGGKPIVIDLAALEFIDSAGLGMLLIARDEAVKASRSLVLRGPQGQVRRMFAATKFETLFTIEA